MPDYFKSLGEVFKNAPGLHKLRSVVKSSDVINDFFKIMPEFKKVAVPYKVNKTALVIKVENPAWRSELRFKENEIINKINDYYKEVRIKQIRFIG